MSKKGEVAKAGQFSQSDVPAMLEKVTAQLDALVGDDTKKAKTTDVECPGFGYLNDIEDVQQLIKAHSSINAKKAGFDASVKEMKLTLKLKPFTINGIAPDVWKKDIMARISIVANKVQIAKLKKIKATLETNLSAEAKLAKDLADINNDMDDMSF